MVDVGKVQVDVIESEMRKTPRGVEGSATVKLPDGRTVKMRGVWEDPYKACREPDYQENPAKIEEYVQIDGVEQPPDGENSIYIEEYDLDIETIAEAIAK